MGRETGSEMAPIASAACESDGDRQLPSPCAPIAERSHLVSDHVVLLLVLKHTVEDREREGVVDLPENVGLLVTQKRRVPHIEKPYKQSA